MDEGRHRWTRTGANLAAASQDQPCQDQQRIIRSLYDVKQLFPAGVGCCTHSKGTLTDDSRVSKETMNWLSKSSLTISVVGLISKFWMSGKNSMTRRIRFGG